MRFPDTLQTLHLLAQHLSVLPWPSRGACPAETVGDRRASHSVGSWDVMLKSFVDVPTERAAGVYHRESRSGKYQLTYAEAKAVCEYEGGHLATYQQLEAARKIGWQKNHSCLLFTSLVRNVFTFHEC